VTVATLNYDLSVETAAQSAHIACDTGIESWLFNDHLDWRGDGVKLLKLHGSIDWTAKREQGRGQLPYVNFESTFDSRQFGEPAVIFGEGSKLRAEGPFLELLLAWAADLNETDHLLIVGYSFRDPHVNETIARWFNADRTRAIVLLSPSDLDEVSASNEYVRALTRVVKATPAEQGGPTLLRFRHVQGRTRDVLSEAIRAATQPALIG
jgi:hypothetical protein